MRRPKSEMLPEKLREEIGLGLEVVLERLKGRREKLGDTEKELDSYLLTLEKACKIQLLLEKKPVVAKKKKEEDEETEGDFKILGGAKLSKFQRDSLKVV